MTGRKVPPRWLECPRKGKVLAGKMEKGRGLCLYSIVLGKFLPFKTPLSGNFIDMREDCQFSPNMLLEVVSGRGLNMGLVIDLTKTDRLFYLLTIIIILSIINFRFYDKAELVSKGVGHYKLKCEGSVTSLLYLCL